MHSFASNRHFPKLLKNKFCFPIFWTYPLSKTGPDKSPRQDNEYVYVRCANRKQIKFESDVNLAFSFLNQEYLKHSDFRFPGHVFFRTVMTKHRMKRDLSFTAMHFPSAKDTVLSPSLRFLTMKCRLLWRSSKTLGRFQDDRCFRALCRKCFQSLQKHCQIRMIFNEINASTWRFMGTGAIDSNLSTSEQLNLRYQARHHQFIASAKSRAYWS